jgi:hypothetical protein
MNKNNTLSVSELFQLLTENKGFTLDHTLAPYSGKGYAVALQGKETQVKETDLDLNKFSDLLARYSERLENNQFLGSWIDQGIVYFDISEISESIGEALTKGKERDQIGIFSFDTFETIYIN